MVSVPKATELACIVAVMSAFALPSKDTEPATSPLNDIVRAVSKALAVSAFPVTSPVTLPVTFPVTLPVKFPVTFVVIEVGRPTVKVWSVRLTSTSFAVPSIVNVCESKSTAEVVVPSVMSKSCAVMLEST